MGGPDAKDLKETEERAIEMARGAGALLADQFARGVRAEFKDERKKRDPVTEADRMSQEFLRKRIETHFPGHAILGEERLDRQGTEPEWVWVLDPLDGTTNFMRGLDVYGVSVGVLHYGRPVAGAIFLAGGSGGRVFHARAGGGAHLEGERISVAREAVPAPTHLVCLPGHYRSLFEMQSRLRKQPGEVRGTGCIVHDMARTADGTFHYAVFAGPRIWDVAAGVLLVKEAGGEALVRRAKGMMWRPLERFARDYVSPPRSLEELREWKAALIVGNKAIARFVGDNLRRSVRGRLRPPHLSHLKSKRKPPR
ncbi:MAG: inositol monophosphatase [Candidatus Tectomicrobia bacterium]|nr:inositol monophosphatase [Candidatus Tectomicrobia bacterium]